MSKVENGKFYWAILKNRDGVPASVPCPVACWHGEWFVPLAKASEKGYTVELLSEEAIPLPANWEK